MVRSDMPLDRLHHVLQLAIGWNDSHLHEFVANGVSYAIADAEWSHDVEDERDRLRMWAACGGYARFLDALADPTHADHKQQLEWAGGDLTARSLMQGASVR